MPRVHEWWNEDPPRRPVDYACELARARFWRDDSRRFIETSQDVADAAPLLDLEEELAHAFVLVLSELPVSARLRFAERFYAEREPRFGGWTLATAESRLAVAAAVALRILDLTERPELGDLRVVDILEATAQRDDLSLTPDTAAAHIHETVAQVRTTVARAGDPLRPAPAAAAATAVVEVLDPSSETVALQEVLVRAAWAAVQTWEPERVLAFLLDVDRVVAETA